MHQNLAALMQRDPQLDFLVHLLELAKRYVDPERVLISGLLDPSSPSRSALRPAGRRGVRAGFQTVGDLFAAVRLRAGLEEIRRLSQRVNQYLSERAPWTVIKTDPARAATTVYVALQCIEWLKTMWAPILPESSQLIHETLGFAGPLAGRQFVEEVTEAGGSRHQVLRYDHAAAVGRWEPVTLPIGQAMRTPVAPFRKLDDDVVEKETVT